MGLFKRFFGKGPPSQALVADFDATNEEKQQIVGFLNSTSEKRIKNIIIYGNSGQLKYYKLLKYSILHDPDLDVKYAALKRIHLFSDHADTLTMLTELKNSSNTNYLEPYFSMALSKMGIISLKEFEEKMNNCKGI
ncbi:hypothetical protein BH09BAC6_BH09BAC6_11570 [soil metagenome]|jgi:hypothetical protein